MVSIPDFESGNPGSNPGGTSLAIAQLAEQWTVNPFVGCSSHPSEIYPRGAMDSAPDF
jgi:hypothetical protein